MSSIDSTDFYKSLQISNRMSAEPGKKNDELGKDEFMKLLITQMEHQDPLSPQDNTQYIAQLAQFSSLEGISNLNSTVGNFAVSLQSTQALQASMLVGRSVQVMSNAAELEGSGKPVNGTIALESSSSDVLVAVYTAAGEYLGDIALGSQEAGDVPFEWDGLDTEGEPFEPGMYQFIAYASSDGKYEAVDLYLSQNVTSVALNAGARGEIMLNISGMSQPVALRDVKVIN